MDPVNQPVETETSTAEASATEQKLYSDFSIDLNPSMLMQMLQNSGLKMSEIHGKFDVSAFKTLSFDNTEESVPSYFLNGLKAWPEQLNWAQLNTHLQALMQQWLADYVNHRELTSAHALVQYIVVASDTEENTKCNTLKFHGFMHQILSTVTNQFEQYKLDYWQHFNSETGLPNQKLLARFLDQLLYQVTHEHDPTHHALLVDARNNPLGIIVLNLNIDFDEAFKLNTNAITVIKAAVDTIQSHLSQSSILFQISPYEFAIFVKNLTFPSQINLIISQLIYAFESILSLEKISLILKPYIGGASTFNPETNAATLYEHARIALQQAMLHGQQTQVYESATGSNYVDNQQLEEAIIEALQNNELSTYLQPIVSIANDVCETAEILLRWETNDWPYVPPYRIVETVYKKGFGKVFIRWLINSACQRSADLLFNHNRRVLLTVNISVSDLLDHDLPEMIRGAIELWEIPAENIYFEITESDLLSDESKIIPVIDEIKRLGCGIALDDFGTGYSSMSRLREMPVDYVKIDQMFVRNILSSKEDLEIVHSVIKLAHSLNKQVVCEGVEDIETVNLLKELKCEKIQGFYYSKPIKFEDFVRWIMAFEQSVKFTTEIAQPPRIKMARPSKPVIF